MKKAALEGGLVVFRYGRRIDQRPYGPPGPPMS
jgi:hypothetical protein